jgi:hypothetical protein
LNHRVSTPALLAGASRILAAVAIATIALAGRAATPAIREVPVHFQDGKTGATVKGKLKGDETVDHTLSARAGQSMVVTLKASSTSTYFNVLPPGSETALFVGSTSGDRFEGTLPADGVYRIRVYLMRNAARRNATTTYTVNVGVSGPGGKVDAAPPPAR